MKVKKKTRRTKDARGVEAVEKIYNVDSEITLEPLDVAISSVHDLDDLGISEDLVEDMQL